MIKRVFIAGQKQLAETLFKLCLKHDLTVTGCVCPADDKYLRPLAEANGVKVFSPSELSPDSLINVDIGICAHYFGYISSDLISSARLGWVGYHPSLLPLYRGKNSILDAVKSADKVVGGSIYWLNEGMDRGDIAYQEFRVVDKSVYCSDTAAKRIWVEVLAPLGAELFERAIIDLKRGILIRRPQLKVVT